MQDCIHCGTAFSPSHEGENFCCRGCEFVHGLIQQEGLDRFYDLRDRTTGQPVLDRPFQQAEFGWLSDLQARAEEEAAGQDRRPSLQLHVRGISCVGCVWLIEKVFQRHPGGRSADVFPANGRLDLTWQAGACDLPAFAAELQRFGYTLEPFRESGGSRGELASLAGRLGLCGAFALNAMVFTLPRYLGMGKDFILAGIFELVTIVSATFALLIGGSYFIRRAWAALRQRVLHIDLPIALGIVVAYAGSLAGWALGADKLLYFDFVAIFTFLMLGGRYLHVAATEKVRNNMQGQAVLPEEVTLDDGSVVPLDDLARGTTFLVRSGGLVPVAALLRDERADFSLAWMTGESTPVTIASGRRVAAGAVNLNRHPIRLQAEEPLADSLVATLARQSERPVRSRLLESILRVYLAAVLLVALAGGLAWILTTGDATAALSVVLSILVISCPCALGVALPLLDQRAAAAMQRLGVFVQTPVLWHRLLRVRKLLLDKTGTLTLETPKLENPETLAGLDEEGRAALMALSSASLHPLSRSLHEALGFQLEGEVPAVEDIPGCGLRTADREWSLGKPAWSGGEPATGAETDEPAALSCDLRHRGTLVARFTFAEEARPDAAEALSVLQECARIETWILSGDRAPRVQQLAARLGLPADRARADLSPTDKESVVRELDREDALYLGDGANDSLAFDAALACGTPAADRSVLDRKADFFFTARGLRFLPALFAAAHWRHRAAFQILLFAISYNLVAIAICLAGAMSPLLAAILMPLSSLACLALAARRLPGASAPEAPAAPRPTPDPMPPTGEAAALS